MATETPVYLVHAQGEPVVVRIEGRAHFRNAAPLDEALLHLVATGKRQIVIDFHACESLDSTVLGILAGVGLALMDAAPPGKMVLAGLDARQRELMENVGLQHLAELSGRPASSPLEAKAAYVPLTSEAQTSLAAAQLVLKAHEDLVRADEGNASQFRDVIKLVKEDIQAQTGEPT